ncbi:MAG TPA: hypothetical protein DEP51_03490, partial [Clostridiales bacterium]|nr:hypothetical protein [Clostridiales bacterium]
MQKLELAQNKLIQYNQEEVLSVLNSLDGNEKEELIEQILKIDFEEITKLYENVKSKEQSQKCEIQPIDYIDKDKLSSSEKEELENIGLNIIKQNKYAVVTMAG